MKKNWWLFLIIGLLIVWVVSGNLSNGQPTEINNKEPQLWPAEIAQLKTRLNKLKLPALAEEGSVLHTHQHLDIYVSGQHIEIPAGIGINEKENFSSPIHTHDTSGIIHVESPTKDKFNLGQFLEIWGIPASDSAQFKGYVNGKPADGDVKNIELTEHEEIVLTLGSEQGVPNPIPQSYNFPADE
jgi:hypothetical protein